MSRLFEVARTAGSSPLTRGKRRIRGQRPSRDRLIPAHAGKTSLRTSSWSVTTAHPRSRGENEDGKPSHIVRPGSSPLTRGKRDRGAEGLCARLAHPRSRGENPTHPPRGGQVSGSSPLTRGKLLQRERQQGRHGLIPAHAGKTQPPRPPRLPRAAHPRSRGENSG